MILKFFDTSTTLPEKNGTGRQAPGDRRAEVTLSLSKRGRAIFFNAFKTTSSPQKSSCNFYSS